MKNKEKKKLKWWQEILIIILIPTTIFIIGAVINGIYSQNVNGDNDNYSKAQEAYREQLKIEDSKNSEKYREKVKQIKIGMTYNQVCNIMEFEGTTLIGDTQNGQFDWKYTSSKILRLVFTAGKVSYIVRTE